MAAAGGDGRVEVEVEVEDDDDEFDAYNPRPYGGGYDIAATYGAPLTPSPSICYPVSSSSAATPTAPTLPAPAPATPPSSSPARPLPVAPAPAPATPPSSSPARPLPVAPAPAPATPPPSSPARPPPVSPVAEPYYWPKPHDYGDAPTDQPMYATPEVFRGWPYFAGSSQCHCRCRRDYWRQWMRGLDFLFGHSDGYGERVIGADRHGVPVYANKKGGVEDAVVVEVPPPAIGTVEWHDAGEVPEQSNLLSWYDNAKEDTYASAEPTCGSYDTSYQQHYSSHGVSVSDEPADFPNQSYQEIYREDASQYQGVSDVSTWFPNQSYQQVYRDEASQYQGVSDESTWFPNQSYQQVYRDESSQYQGVSDESTWFPNQSYQEVYREEASQYQEFLSSYDSENKISAQPIYCYNQHFSEQPLHVQVEPPETAYSHKVEYYENFSTYDNQNNIDNSEVSMHSREIQPYAHTPDDPIEPYKPSWSMNLEYYQACTGGMASEYDNHTLASGEYGDMSSLFVSSFYPQQTQSYDQSHDVESVYLQQSLQSSWNVPSEDASRITNAGADSNHLNGSFWPFGEY